MPRIRADLDGVLYVQHPDSGDAVPLTAGDEVPSWARVGEHLHADAVGLPQQWAGLPGATPPIDPAGMTVADVNAWLEEHAEQMRAVLAAEAAGRNRAGIVRGPHRR